MSGKKMRTRPRLKEGDKVKILPCYGVSAYVGKVGRVEMKFDEFWLVGGLEHDENMCLCFLRKELKLVKRAKKK